MFDVDAQNITNITDIVTFLGWSPPTRELLLAFKILVVMLGLCGNGLVFYASVIHQAIKMDKVTVLFVENLAALDFLITLVYYLPTLITLYAKRWVLGKAVCFINAYLSAVLCINEIMLIAAIASYRMSVLKKPADVMRRCIVNISCIYNNIT